VDVKRYPQTPFYFGRTHLNRRKKVLPGEFLKGLDTVSTHDQSCVLQILTVLSSLYIAVNEGSARPISIVDQKK
jgi:hypothetical protein